MPGELAGSYRQFKKEFVWEAVFAEILFWVDADSYTPVRSSGL